MQKNELRQIMLKERICIEPKDALLYSTQITEKLIALDCVKNSKSIMAYYSYKNEPNLLSFIRKCIDLGKCVSLPYIAGEGEMLAVNFNYDSALKSNVYGIPEPVLTNDSEEEEPDVIIVPGIAFDMNLNRIGFGGGYYDRFLENKRAVKIGACFDCQLVESIETEAYDIPMDIIVTEKRILGMKQ